MSKSNDLPKCCVPECSKEAKWRGVCQSCYGQAKRLIDDEKTTWAELEAMGLAIPDTKNKPLLKAFLAKKGPPEPPPANAPISEPLRIAESA